jgi:hypothetical protein
MFKWFCKKWIIVPLSFVFLLFFAISAEAGMVYGRVYLIGGNFPPNEMFTLEDERGSPPIRVSTDGYGNYRLTIPDGHYTARYTARDGEWRGEVWSYPDPIRMDIYMRRR